jgi:hypothetical protein
MPSFIKVERSIVTSRWICRTITLQLKIAIPRIVNRPRISWITSHFQVDQSLQFAQLSKKFNRRIAKLFKQTGSSIKVDLKEAILLNSQSTMDLFCNAALVSKISKSRSSM